MKTITKIKFALLAIFAGLFLTASAQAATYVVDRTDDAAISTCTAAANDCTLRGAISAANGTAANDVINFDASLAGQTITLSGTELRTSGNGSLTINGLGADQLSVSGNDTSRVLSIDSGIVEINNLTFSNGNAGGNFGGGIEVYGTLTMNNSVINGNSANGGGGMFVLNGSATLTNTTVSSNRANGGNGTGGGILSNGSTVTLTNTIVSGNSATNNGGGIFSENAATTTLTNTTVSGNSAGNTGGGIANQGTLTINNSTISGNTAQFVGGIVNFSGTTSINNSTVSGNSATVQDGGIYNFTTLNLNSSTLSNNSSPVRAGIGNGGTANLNNTIIANSNGGGSDCGNFGTINASYSILEDGFTCVNGTNSNNLTGDPNLGPLQDNGGPTQTHALLIGSIATDAGNSALLTDQRGFARPVDDPARTNAGNGSDIGAFEVQIADLSVTKTTAAFASGGTNQSYSISISNNGPSNAASVVLTDPLPAGTTFVSLTQTVGPAFNCTLPSVGSTGTVSCMRGNLGNGATPAFTLTVRVNNNAADGSTLSNTASVSSSTNDPNTANNSSTASSIISNSADVSLSAFGPSTAAAGGTITYSIRITNNGPSDSINQKFTAQIPSGTTFSSVSFPQGWGCRRPDVGDTGSVRCTNQRLEVGETAFITLRVKVNNNAAAGTNIFFTGTVKVGTDDPNEGNNGGLVTTQVN